MGGMGKTTLATEAALWWTRSGLFADGACFVSFEQFTSAERVIAVLGEYCEGPKFHQRPTGEHPYADNAYSSRLRMLEEATIVLGRVLGRQGVRG